MFACVLCVHVGLYVCVCVCVCMYACMFDAHTHTQIAATSLTVNSIRAAGGLRAAVPQTNGSAISLTLLRPMTPSEPRSTFRCANHSNSTSNSTGCGAECVGNASMLLYNPSCANCSCNQTFDTTVLAPSYSLPFLSEARPAQQSSRYNASATGTTPTSSSLWIWLLPPDVHCNQSFTISDPRYAAQIQASYLHALASPEPISPPASSDMNSLTKFGGDGRAWSGTANTSTQAATMQAHLSGAALDAALSTLEQGIYQICVSAEANSSTIGTGLSLTIQPHLTGLEINGLWMGARRDAYNIVARAPRRAGNALRALKSVLRGSAMEQVWWDTVPRSHEPAWPAVTVDTPALAIVGPDMDCHDAGQNLASLSPGIYIPLIHTYIHTYIYIYIYIYICMYTYIHTHTRIHTYTYMHTHILTYAACTCMHIHCYCTRAQTDTFTREHTQIPGCPVICCGRRLAITPLSLVQTCWETWLSVRERGRETDRDRDRERVSVCRVSEWV